MRNLRKITGTTATFYVDDAAIAKHRASDDYAELSKPIGDVPTIEAFREEYGASADGLSDQDIQDINDDPERGEYEDPEGQAVSDDEVAKVIRAAGADKRKAREELAGMTDKVNPDKAIEPKPGKGGVTEGQEARIEATPLDKIQEGMKLAADHRVAVQETLDMMGDDYAPFVREENDVAVIKTEIAALGGKMIKAAERQETHYFSKLVILTANWLDLLINPPGEYAGNAWASAVTVRTKPDGKKEPHLGFDPKKLKADIRDMMGYDDKYRTERKQGALVTLDNIISPAVKASVLVQTKHNGTVLAWFTKRGLHIDEAQTTPAQLETAMKEGAYRTIAMPICNMIPHRKTSKTSMIKETETQLVPMMRGYIDAQYASLVEGAKLTEFGRIAPTKDEDPGTNPVEQLLNTNAHKLDSEQARSLVAAVEHWATNPDLRQRVRKDNLLKAALFSLSETLDKLYNADGDMYSEKELDAIRTAEDRLPAVTNGARPLARRVS